MSKRTELIAKVKELGIETERPAHMCTTSYLEEVIAQNSGAAVTVKKTKKQKPAPVETPASEPKATQKNRILEIAAQGNLSIKEIHEQIVSEGWENSNYRYVLMTVKRAGITVPKLSRKKEEVAESAE